MSKFDIYVKVSILIKYKTKQPSNLAWNTSLTSWLCDIGIRFSVRPSVHLSTFMSKFDIYVKVSILINYKTKQPSNLAWHIFLTSWLGRFLDSVTLTYILHSSDFDTIYVNIPDLLNYKAYNHQTLQSASPRCTNSAGTLTRWPWPVFCTPISPQL